MPTAISQYILELGYPNWHPDYLGDHNAVELHEALSLLLNTHATQTSTPEQIIATPNGCQHIKISLPLGATYISNHRLTNQNTLALRRNSPAVMREANSAAQLLAVFARTLYGTHGLLQRLDAQAYAKTLLVWNERKTMIYNNMEYAFHWGYDTYINVYAADAEGNVVAE